MKITDNNRAKIIESYARSGISRLLSQLWWNAYDTLVNDLNKYTNEELEKEIGEFSPENLENI
jgi:hypothetical protein